VTALPSLTLRSLTLATGLVLSSFLLAHPAFGQTFKKVKPHPAEKGKTCSTAGCHAKLKIGKVVHQPTAMDDCEICHEKKGPAYALAYPSIGEMCTECHELSEGAKVHTPYKKKECTGCHNPHASDNDKLLVQPNDQRLCYQCHEKAQGPGANAKNQHGPFAMGACVACHAPHAGTAKANLVAKASELCLGCHETLADDIKSSRHVHRPVKNGCTKCHSPHGTDQAYFLLKGGAPSLCLSCHKRIAGKINDKEATVHGPIKTKKSCVGCHNPHVSPQPKLLQETSKELCLTCHGVSVGGLTAMGKLLEENPNHHGPIRDGSCIGCHDPHASPNFRLLVKAYPKRFYAPFKQENYALCFGCHEPERVLEKTTKTLTNFREGDRNLHFVHVNKKRKGRTCRACHEVHASKHPLHLRDSVPFGRWALPINFKKTPTGGSCSPGCHQPKTYNRGD